MHDDILSIVIKIYVRVITALLMSRDSQPEDFFRIFFHQDLGEEKSVTLLIGFSYNPSGSYRKKQKQKSAVVNPP